MKNISDLRNELFETIQALKDGKIDVEKAKAISDIGQVIVNSAKTEVDFIKHAGGVGTGFIEFNVANVKKLDRPKAEYSNNGHEATLKKYGS